MFQISLLPLLSAIRQRWGIWEPRFVVKKHQFVGEVAGLQPGTGDAAAQ